MRCVAVISAVVFGLVSVGHLARLFTQVVVTIEGWDMPVWMNVVGFLGAGALCAANVWAAVRAGR